MYFLCSKYQRLTTLTATFGVRHNTKRYRQADDGRTEHRTISATALPSTVG